MNRKIIKRKYTAVQIELISPLAVSSGENLYSDADVMRDGSGEVFVPGTSLAGAFRNLLQLDERSEKVMGYSDGGQGQMSSLYVSDLYFEKEDKQEPVLSIRDRVCLTRKKTVDNKFDVEIIEPGIRGVIFLNYVQREGDEENFEKAIADILQETESGAIRFGANKNRGFGRFRILKIYEKEFTESEVDEWIAFVPVSKKCNSYGEGTSYEDWVADKEKTHPGYVKICVPLRLIGGISIRRYSTRPNMPDFEHISCGTDEKGLPIPIIPGTSWNGAIRSASYSVLTELVGEKKAEKIICAWFGNVNVKAKDKTAAWQSAIVVGESRIKDGTWLPMTRNQINRFDASTKNGALYSEQSYFGGNTILELMVRKEADYEACIGFLIMAISDLANGYVSVGGQTAVGRGLFEKRDEIKFSEPVDEEKCSKALYDLLYNQEV
jgi:CRISPR/Cas system CSM-associated protein Csm3 (group 7 of RAMP superfamily)